MNWVVKIMVGVEAKPFLVLLLKIWYFTTLDLKKKPAWIKALRNMFQLPWRLNVLKKESSLIQIIL